MSRPIITNVHRIVLTDRCVPPPFLFLFSKTKTSYIEETEAIWYVINDLQLFNEFLKEFNIVDRSKRETRRKFDFYGNFSLGSTCFKAYSVKNNP